MLENVRLAARGRDGPAANELSSIDAGPVDWGMRGVEARNRNVRVTDGNIVRDLMVYRFEMCAGM